MNPPANLNPNHFENPNFLNHNNFFFQSLPPPQQQPPPPPPPPQNPPIPDISNALSSLTNLLSLSQQTLISLSSLLQKPISNNNDKNVSFVSCPYNPNHLMPPESLFLHSLRCPSPLFEDPMYLINSLHYPTTLSSSSQKKTTIFNDNSNGTDLCLSLDGFYSEFSTNFFYKDCPGVVQFHDLDSSSKTFMLPSVLSLECANFVARNEEGARGFDGNSFRILPSDLWVIRREVESWTDYPSMYSYAVFCVVLRLNLIRMSELRRWVIADSPRFGVVIDVYMRDHISVLFRLCLNAIRREALTILGHGMNVKTLSFNCPLLGHVLMWVVSQLSILYGGVNAKCLAMHIFRQCILEVSNEVLLLPLEANVKEISRELKGSRSDVKFQEPLEGSTVCQIETEVDESVDKEVIFVSQVAAAVASLHERALLEAKIKGLREHHRVPRYQRMNEHEYVSKRADEERNRRSNYRAIIDHDGLPRMQLSNQDTSKTKTREELLAEERDYKRRRMSYRGKKMKRTTLQVTRDIIEEYMKEIEQAGGIGCFELGAEEEGMSSKQTFSIDFSMRGDQLKKSSGKSDEAMKATPDDYKKQSHSDLYIRSTASKDASDQDQERHGKVRHRHHEHVQYQKSNYEDRHGRGYYSRTGSSARLRSHGPLHEQRSHQSEQDEVEFSNNKHHDRRSTGKSNHHKLSYYGSDLANIPRVPMDDKKLDARDWRLRNPDGIDSSKSMETNAFEDRYDPAKSHGTNEDDAYAEQQAY